MILPTVVELATFVVTLVGFLFRFLASILTLIHVKALQYRDDAGKWILPCTPSLSPPPPPPPLRGASFEASVLEILRKQNQILGNMEDALEQLAGDVRAIRVTPRNPFEGLQLITTALARPPD
ncbi:hypothetical protein BP6252_12771 [Coleophoma cylindrospora]|uniref:Uncharacterized protein n=1 Tax=Coleophoma cylindrospora TaxID=1849047 RepID=A0A3D8QE29_9HELO|nr:hypothetical protein BP6252_12771 [Coleophoma cylindrospora]